MLSWDTWNSDDDEEFWLHENAVECHIPKRECALCSDREEREMVRVNSAAHS